MLEILLNNKSITTAEDGKTLSTIKSRIFQEIGISFKDIYVLVNGKLCSEDLVLHNCKVHFMSRLCGGKGGFGSMLRAIGAQIEKTTNREACRDLSGRRLRDINEEQRLKTWIAQQADREKEAVERKKKKLEKLCQEPKFEFKDENYDKERSELPEKVEVAVLKGLQIATSSGISKKRKGEGRGPKSKKPKLWVDGDLDDELSLSSENSDSDSELQEIVIASSSKNRLETALESTNNSACRQTGPENEDDENGSKSEEKK
ncbi:replication stress response regulator SDE2 [Agrilus planipennis]|uniref:Replication stress response regulator SDE2 n=1 Tax=Agrilus planipennis TaxID=224129 RepID=A0A1W4XDA7_AGRPL|nr:replication stress response regulator SDE2 [Agrilus planipennis]